MTWLDECLSRRERLLRREVECGNKQQTKVAQMCLPHVAYILVLFTLFTLLITFVTPSKKVCDLG